MWSCWSGGEQVQVEKVGEKEVCAQAENDITDMLLTTHAIMSAADEKAAAEEALKKKAEEDAKQFEQSMKDGEAAFDRSDWSAAVACFTEAIDFDPMCGNAWAGRGGRCCCGPRPHRPASSCMFALGGRAAPRRPEAAGVE